ncbi:MAG: peptide-methionine (S)-S-oxide reductase [Omnitrophica WOR_2 bacterium RIFCSPHIGHO2_02_FULL_52_10]|nr:MAG: peptide-methionine (S)-S-oxide reductase [Omnitrophica WOR_2 bacterium RIFCSPHIGHO2_02_FULL_52_10]
MVSKGAIHKEMKLATFAGGCFWCMEKPYEQYDGIHSVISGFSGGQEENPSYEEVSSGGTGHREAVQVTFDPARITYDELLDIFWRQIDPTDDGGQFADKGRQYTTAIFYHDEEQKNLAEASKKKLEDSKKFDKPIATNIISYTTFYPAEEDHQDYYKKAPIRYNSYYLFSGRGPYLKKVWGKK